MLQWPAKARYPGVNPFMIAVIIPTIMNVIPSMRRNNLHSAVIENFICISLFIGTDLPPKK
jgi:hypothetical protein